MVAQYKQNFEARVVSDYEYYNGGGNYLTVLHVAVNVSPEEHYAVVASEDYLCVYPYAMWRDYEYGELEDLSDYVLESFEWDHTELPNEVVQASNYRDLLGMVAAKYMYDYIKRHHCQLWKDVAID